LEIINLMKKIAQKIICLYLWFLGQIGRATYTLSVTYMHKDEELIKTQLSTIFVLITNAELI